MNKLKNLRLSHLKNLLEINGFENLTVVEEDLNISFLNSLSALEFKNIQEIGGYLGVSNCDGLRNVNFESLVRIGNSLIFSSNLITTDLILLENLVELNSLNIISNPELKNIEGLKNINAVKRIEVRSNQIEDFCPLKNAILNNAELERLNISGNLEMSYFEECD